MLIRSDKGNYFSKLCIMINSSIELIYYSTDLHAQYNTKDYGRHYKIKLGDSVIELQLFIPLAI